MFRDLFELIFHYGMVFFFFEVGEDFFTNNYLYVFYFYFNGSLLFRISLLNIILWCIIPYTLLYFKTNFVKNVVLFFHSPKVFIL